MTTAVELTVEERLGQLLRALGIERAHVVACAPGDCRVLAPAAPAYAASLTLVCAPAVMPEAMTAFASRLLVVTADAGAQAEQVRRAIGAGAQIEHLALRGPVTWYDAADAYAGVLGPALLDFLDRQNARARLAAVSLPEGEGEVSGIRYRIHGSGVPLLLLPLGFAPTQWEPFLPYVAGRYCAIVLGGPHLGVAALLEGRAGSSGYQRMFRTLVDAVDPRPGEAILDAGCGTGALDRLLAGWTGGANRITAVDHSPYLLGEAAALARRAGLDEAIDFREGDAASLPFPDASFDVVLSCTVAEEGDADRMLREFVRVTKPGGRVGVIVRAMDIGWWLGVPLRPELKARLEAPGVVGAVAERGCADGSLYRRCREAGLELLLATPQLGSVAPGAEAMTSLQGMQAFFLSRLNPAEAEEWRAALAAGLRDGTLSAAAPYHCAVGRRV